MKTNSKKETKKATWDKAACYRSETGKLQHIRDNEFTYGQVIVTKYYGGCTARLGNAMSWEAPTEKELIARVDAAGYGKDS